MKVVPPLVTLILVIVLAGAGSAQQKPAPAPTTAPQGTGAVPDVKMAIVYSDDFLDEKTGIVRYTVLVNALNKEFEARINELKQLEQKMKQLQDEIVAMQKAPTTPQAQFQAKLDQLEQMKKDYQRKGEDTQAAYDKRKATILQPLQEDIVKAIEVYAKAHNIGVVIDRSQVPLVFTADTLDITRGFILDYNSKNPATAAVTTPR